MRLHLGCGSRHIPGFVHVDQVAASHVDHCRDIRDLSFLSAESVDLIYSSHAFEYFDRAEAVSVLKEWRRVLRSGAMLRMAVPDFAVLAELYLSGLPLDKLLGPLYGKIPAQQGFAYHKTVYDFTSLEALLQEVGFIHVRRYDWRETEHKYYDDFSQAYIPHMDKKSGRLISLNIEAIKS